MRTVGTSLLLAAIAAATTSRTARAADERLLVVVESAPGVAVDARDVRQRIGAELGIAVVAPTDAAAAGASNVLVVAIDKAEIRMSLRGSAAGLVARTIPLPLDRTARLREIGWLAGNLARDQVSGIVAVPAERAGAPRELPVAAADEAPATATAPQSAPATPELPMPPARVSGSEAEATISARPIDAAVSHGPRWTITAAGGPTATFVPPGRLGGPVIRDTTYELELQRQASPDSLIFGAALEAGTDSSSSLIGIAGFVGSDWRHRHWFLETTAGAGLELARLYVANRTVTNSSLTGTSSETTVSSERQPVLYVRGVGTLGFPISSSLDLVGRLGIHLASSGGFATDFLSATVGLRFRLP